jgi:Protein of unknown function (DUF3307)
MPWVEVFVVFVMCHLVGDYLLQTEWQAVNKHGGLSGPPEARRALLSHIATYTLSFVPAMVWLWGSRGAWVLGLLAVIAIPHLIQDDGRLLAGYSLRVKKADIDANPLLAAALDQSFHLLALFGTALLASR